MEGTGTTTDVPPAYPPQSTAPNEGIVLSGRRASAVVLGPEVEIPRDGEINLEHTKDFVGISFAGHYSLLSDLASGDYRSL